MKYKTTYEHDAKITNNFTGQVYLDTIAKMEKEYGYKMKHRDVSENKCKVKNRKKFLKNIFSKFA